MHARFGLKCTGVTDSGALYYDYAPYRPSTRMKKLQPPPHTVAVQCGLLPSFSFANFQDLQPHRVLRRLTASANALQCERQAAKHHFGRSLAMASFAVRCSHHAIRGRKLAAERAEGLAHMSHRLDTAASQSASFPLAHSPGFTAHGPTGTQGVNGLVLQQHEISLPVAVAAAAAAGARLVSRGVCIGVQHELERSQGCDTRAGRGRALLRRQVWKRCRALAPEPVVLDQLQVALYHHLQGDAVRNQSQGKSARRHGTAVTCTRGAQLV